MKITVSFNENDVTGLFKISDKEAEKFLSAHGKEIEEYLAQKGNEMIEELGDADGLPKNLVEW